MSHCEADTSLGKETLCKQLGGKITRLRASGKELESEVRQLTAERDRYMAVLEHLNREAALCDAHGITLQFVQFVLSKTAEALKPKEAP